MQSDFLQKYISQNEWYAQFTKNMYRILKREISFSDMNILNFIPLILPRAMDK